MSTRAKLNTASLCASAMIFLNVFSRPLGIPEAWQWVLMIGVFIPLGLTFVYIRRAKGEHAGASVQQSAAGTPTSAQAKIRRTFFVAWACGVGFALASPLWLPVTGVTLGTRGNFAVGAITAVIVSALFAFRLKKLPNKPLQRSARDLT